MRNAILILLLALTICAPASAKKKATWKKGYLQNDWTVGYGYKSCMMTVSGLKDVEMSDVTKMTVTADNRESIGSIGLNYTHRKGRLVSFGLAAAFEMTKEDCLINKRVWSQDGVLVDNFEKVGELSNKYITVTPLIRFNWAEWNQGKVVLYTKLAVGVTFIGDSYTDKSTDRYEVQSKKQHYFGFQASPLGLMIGRKAGGFIEVGYGSYGIAQAGFCYRF